MFYTVMMSGGRLVAFEFDETKPKANAAKHGIDFVAAQALWLDERVIEIPAKTVDEPRSLIIGRIEGRHYSAVITHRGNRIRIISVRRSRDKEVALYEGE